MAKKELIIMAIAAILGLSVAGLIWPLLLPAGAWLVKMLSIKNVLLTAILAIGFYWAALFVLGMIFSRLLPDSRLSIQLLQIVVCYFAQAVVFLFRDTPILYMMGWLAIANIFCLVGFIYSSQGRSISPPSP